MSNRIFHTSDELRESLQRSAKSYLGNYPAEVDAEIERLVSEARPRLDNSLDRFDARRMQAIVALYYKTLENFLGWLNLRNSAANQPNSGAAKAKVEKYLDVAKDILDSRIPTSDVSKTYERLDLQLKIAAMLQVEQNRDGT